MIQLRLMAAEISKPPALATIMVLVRGTYIYRVASLFPFLSSVPREATMATHEHIPATRDFRRCDDMESMCCLTQDSPHDRRRSNSTLDRPYLARPHPRCGQKHIRRLHSSPRPRAAIGHVVGPSPASPLSLDRSRLRSVAVVALRPHRSPATSWARRLRSRHSRFYDLVLRPKDIVGNYNATNLPRPGTSTSPPHACRPSPHDPVPSAAPMGSRPTARTRQR